MDDGQMPAKKPKLYISYKRKTSDYQISLKRCKYAEVTVQQTVIEKHHPYVK